MNLERFEKLIPSFEGKKIYYRESGAECIAIVKNIRVKNDMVEAEIIQREPKNPKFHDKWSISAADIIFSHTKTSWHASYVNWTLEFDPLFQYLYIQKYLQKNSVLNTGVNDMLLIELKNLEKETGLDQIYHVLNVSSESTIFKIARIFNENTFLSTGITPLIKKFSSTLKRIMNNPNSDLKNLNEHFKQSIRDEIQQETFISWIKILREEGFCEKK